MKETAVVLTGTRGVAGRRCLPAGAPGLLTGFGFFETMRFRRGGCVALDAHIERLRASCVRAGLKLKTSPAALKRDIIRFVASSGITDARARLTVWDGCVLMSVRKCEGPAAARYSQGYAAELSRVRVDETSVLAGMKSVSRMHYELAYRAAVKRGYDEAVLLDRRGFLSEGSRSNLFFVCGGGTLHTPALSCGCLAGVTRGLVIRRCRGKNIVVRQGECVPRDLLNAREAFLTNAQIGIMPLTRVGKRVIGTGRPGPVTAALACYYGELIRDAAEKV